jgi:hypothetical protein
MQKNTMIEEGEFKGVLIFGVLQDFEKLISRNL